MRRVALFLLALGLPAWLAGCGLVSAEQYVDATAQFWLLGRDHVLYSVNVELLASTDLTNTFDAAQKGFAYLVVRAAACPHGKCGASTVYVQPLPASRYRIGDLTTITVTSGSFGGGLSVVWSGSGPGGAVDTVPNANGADADASSGWAATAKVTAFGRTCTDATAAAARHTHAAPHAFTKPIGKAAPFGTGRGLPPRPATCSTAPRR